MLRDGTGLVVKRVEALSTEGALRLVSAHPDDPPYERPADEAMESVITLLWNE